MLIQKWKVKSEKYILEIMFDWLNSLEMEAESVIDKSTLD